MTEEIIQSIATFSGCSLSNTPVADSVDGLSSLLLVKFLCATLYRMDQHTRLELALSVWKTDVLPLHQCWVLHPILHGCGCALGRNPQLIFPDQSAGISKMSRRAPALTWVTLFFTERRPYAVPQENKRKNCGWWWESDLNRYGRVVSHPANLLPSCTGFEWNPVVSTFLGFSR